MAKAKRLRPLGTADLLDETVELYKSNFALLVGISAVVNLPIGLVYAFSMPNSKAFLNGLAVLAVGAFVSPLAAAALVFAASDRHLDMQTSITSCYRRSWTRSVYWRMLGVSLLQVLAFWGGIMVAVIPASILAVTLAFAVGASKSSFGLIFGAGILLLGMAGSAPLWVRLMLAGPVVVLEEQGIGSAIRRSWSLIKGSVMQSTLVIIVAYILIHAVSFASSWLLAPLTGCHSYYQVPLAIRVIQQGASILANVILAPLTMIAQTLLYFDQRVRKEGFDLELLAKDLEQKGAPAQ